MERSLCHALAFVSQSGQPRFRYIAIWTIFAAGLTLDSPEFYSTYSPCSIAVLKDVFGRESEASTLAGSFARDSSAPVEEMRGWTSGAGSSRLQRGRDWKPAQPNSRILAARGGRYFKIPLLDTLEFHVNVSNQNLKAQTRSISRCGLSYATAGLTIIRRGRSDHRRRGRGYPPTSKMSLGRPCIFNLFLSACTRQLNGCQFRHMSNPWYWAGPAEVHEYIVRRVLDASIWPVKFAGCL
jgi:hypothetical protein